MGYYLKCFTTMALIAILLATVSCGKKGKSFGAKVSVNPERPIVITGKFTYLDKGAPVEVVGPWFKYQVDVQNDTGDQFVIVSMQLEVTGVDENGIPQTVTSTYDPSTRNYSFEDPITMITTECVYLTYGDWPIGATSKIRQINSNPSCGSGNLTFFSSGNPNPGTSGNFHYTGKIRLIGWFGTYDVATERFDRTVYFTTQ